MGIRAALGASPGSLARLVIGGGMRFAVIGLTLGCVAALGVNRLLSSLLFGVESSDPITLIATVTVLAGVAATACYVPAHHASRIDPLDALRAE
jgi:ABC-type antimicrobial peptide transport system permease subunit